MFGKSLPSSIEVAGLRLPLVVRRSRRARRLTLRACAPSRTIRLTLPWRHPPGDALAFVSAHRDWLEAEVSARFAAPSPFLPDGLLMLADEGLWLRAAPVRRAVRADSALLVPEGEAPAFNAQVVGFAKRQARLLMTAEAQAMAASIGRCLGSVRIGDPRSRWGSCSAAGGISLSWRLVMAPGFVRRSVVAHEVAHLVHMNHGREFHGLAEHILGGPHGPARAWLRANGAQLFSLGSFS